MIVAILIVELSCVVLHPSSIRIQTYDSTITVKYVVGGVNDTLLSCFLYSSQNAVKFPT